MNDRMRVSYQDELDRLESHALGGFELVLRSLDRTIETVERRDMELARLVIADDDLIDTRYLEVHQGLIALLATQSPVATDLRLISALLHVIKGVERMGDQCVNICKLAPLADSILPASEELLTRFSRMGRQAHTQVRQAQRAFAERDEAMAQDLVKQDDLIDRLNRECFSIALEIGHDQDQREWAMTMLLSARALERIGDNAVDVGEQVAFIVTGLFREFEDASHPV